MSNTKVIIDEKGVGEVQVFENGAKIGKMDIAVKNDRLTVYHTEVDSEYEGRGFARLLLDQLVSYAREKQLKIIPLCPYVRKQFFHHPENYVDVWAKDWHA